VRVSSVVTVALRTEEIYNDIKYKWNSVSIAEAQKPVEGLCFCGTIRRERLVPILTVLIVPPPREFYFNTVDGGRNHLSGTHIEPVI
jgi:hypothetical protein